MTLRPQSQPRGEDRQPYRGREDHQAPAPVALKLAHLQTHEPSRPGTPLGSSPTARAAGRVFLPTREDCGIPPLRNATGTLSNLTAWVSPDNLPSVAVTTSRAASCWRGFSIPAFSFFESALNFLVIRRALFAEGRT